MMRRYDMGFEVCNRAWWTRQRFAGTCGFRATVEFGIGSIAGTGFVRDVLMNGIDLSHRLLRSVVLYRFLGEAIWPISQGVGPNEQAYMLA